MQGGGKKIGFFGGGCVFCAWLLELHGGVLSLSDGAGRGVLRVDEGRVGYIEQGEASRDGEARRRVPHLCQAPHGSTSVKAVSWQRQSGAEGVLAYRGPSCNHAARVQAGRQRQRSFADRSD